MTMATSTGPRNPRTVTVRRNFLLLFLLLLLFPAHVSAFGKNVEIQNPKWGLCLERLFSCKLIPMEACKLCGDILKKSKRSVQSSTCGSVPLSQRRAVCLSKWQQHVGGVIAQRSLSCNHSTHSRSYASARAAKVTRVKMKQVWALAC